MHAAYLGRGDELRRVAPLLVHDAAFFLTWPKRALEFVRARGDAGAVELRALEHIASCYDKVAETLSAIPATLLHGELYPSNVLVQTRGGGRRVCPIDWELAAIGPGVVDLAALLSGGWKEENRREMTDAYLSAWPEQAGPRTDPVGFREALALSRLHIAMQWLGWAPSWRPPLEHAHDWLREAITLGDEIGL
jgi:Ser/Thr protein kinase RdoA (MazF antagonist)